MSDYVVVCKISEDERMPDDPKGNYVRATRQLFPTEDAAARYATTVTSSREPRVVTVSDYLVEIWGWRRSIGLNP